MPKLATQFGYFGRSLAPRECDSQCLALRETLKGVSRGAIEKYYRCKELELSRLRNELCHPLARLNIVTLAGDSIA